jgi:hypothetical protein
LTEYEKGEYNHPLKAAGAKDNNPALKRRSTSRSINALPGKGVTVFI